MRAVSASPRMTVPNAQKVSSTLMPTMTTKAPMMVAAAVMNWVMPSCSVSATRFASLVMRLRMSPR